MKYYGTIGYEVSEEEVIDGKTTGVFIDKIIEKKYYGNVLKFSRNLSNGLSINDNIEISNEISIIADAFAYSNFQNIAYVEWMGTKWKVPNVRVEHPRLVLRVGGVYNEQKT